MCWSKNTSSIHPIIAASTRAMFAAETLALLYEEGRRTNAVHGGVAPSAAAYFCLFENGTHDELCDDALFADGQNEVHTVTVRQ